MYDHWKTGGLFLLLFGIGFILIGALLPYGLQLKIEKQIQGEVKLERDQYAAWGAIPGNNSESLEYTYTFNTQDATTDAITFSMNQTYENPDFVESDSALEMRRNITATGLLPAGMQIQTPNLRAQGLLTNIRNRDQSKIMIPALHDLLNARQDLYYAYILGYFMYYAGLNQDYVRNAILENVGDAPTAEKVASDPDYGFGNFTGASVWVRIHNGDAAQRSIVMEHFGLTLGEVSSIALNNTNYFYSLYRLVYWRVGRANGCSTGCSAGNLMKIQHSELGPLYSNLADFAQDLGVPRVESVINILSETDALPLAPEYAYYSQSWSNFSNLTSSQWASLTGSGINSLLNPANMLLIFENDKGNVGMADVVQRLALAYEGQVYSVLNYLKHIRENWAHKDGEEMTAFSFLARSFMENYLPNQLYKLAGECANNKTTWKVFQNWTEYVSKFTCADLIDAEHCQGQTIADFYQAAYFGRGTPQFEATMKKMALSADVLQSLVNGTESGTYGGELIAMKRYISLSFGCADPNACTDFELGADQWFSSKWTQAPPPLIAGQQFICDEEGLIEQKAALKLLGYSPETDAITQATFKKFYGQDATVVNYSLLIDQYMKEFFLLLNTEMGNQTLQYRYTMNRPDFWRDYLLATIERYMLNNNQEANFTISAQQLLAGMIENPLLSYMSKNETGAELRGYDRAIANMTYLPRWKPNPELLEDVVQLHTGHREVKNVRSYNRFISKAQLYKSIFFYNPQLSVEKRNQTVQTIPWAGEVQIQGTDGIQFHPNIEGSDKLHILDPIHYRSYEYEKFGSSSAHDLDIYKYRMNAQEMEVSGVNDVYYQTEKCKVNLTSVYNVPIWTTQGIDGSNNCQIKNEVWVDQLSGFTNTYQFYDEIWAREAPNMALPSLGNSTKDYKLYSLQRVYTREPESIRAQFKEVDDLRSYKSSIILAFYISGGVLVAAGLAILITVCCAVCKKKRNNEDYEFYDTVGQN